MVWDEDVNISHMLAELNTLIPFIPFTHELEVEGRIPFLNIEIIKGTYPSFNVFRKKTFANSFVHFYSNHPNSIKKSVVFGQFLRAFRTCDPPFIDNEIKFIFVLFLKLCYPKHFIFLLPYYYLFLLTL